jgi:hypothetical protein
LLGEALIHRRLALELLITARPGRYETVLVRPV